MKKEKINFQYEDLNSKKKRVQSIISRFRKEYPNPKCHLDFKTPLELLVATILSAQCTDERVNQVTKGLFKKYRTANDYANAHQEELEDDVRSTGFFRNKAKAVINSCRVIDQRYNGKVPASMESLTELDGVGRKTANVVLGNAYGIPGIIVDTHVKRLANRIGLSSKTDPDKIEADMMELLPKEEWTYFSHALSDHGRKVCHARKPLCKSCKINDLCPSAEL
ncbi:MAG: endonuclease III [Candidatus Dadabacteria bacterium]|nr:endonuclease III [Candidatus Dadabacteria bacterium]